METYYSASKPDRHRFCPTFGLINFFDSSRGAYLEDDIDEIDYRIRITKRNGCFIIYPSDSLDVILDLYLVTNPPPDNYEIINSVHIVEGIISVGSGVLCISDDVPPKAEFHLESANYKFRVFFSDYDCDNDSTTLSIFFWPTKEHETNEIEVLKQEEINC